MIKRLTVRKGYETVLILILALLVTVKFTGEFLGINLILMVLVSILIALVVLLFPSFRFSSLADSYNLVFCGFLFLMIISLIWTTAPNYGLDKVRVLIPLLLVPLFAGNIWVKRYELFLKFISIAMILVSIYILVFKRDVFLHMVIGAVGGAGRFRLQDGLNSNVISVYFGFGLIALVNYFKAIPSLNDKFSKWLHVFFWNISVFVFFLLGLFFLFFTGSRGALIAFIGSFVLYYLLYKDTVRKVGSVLIFGGLLFFILNLLDIEQIVYSIAPDDYHGFLRGRFFDDTAGESVNARYILIDLAISTFNYHNPFEFLFGNGIGSFGYCLTGTDERSYPHNLIVEIIYELGFLALGLFSLCIYYVIRRMRNAVNQVSKTVFIHFFFLLMVAQSTGDIPTNFLLFTYIILVLKIEPSVDIKKS